MDLHKVSFCIAELCMTSIYWTSGTNAGFGCDLNFGWCGSKTTFPSNMTWLTGEPNGYATENCVVISLNASPNQLGGFDDVPCDLSYNFICEVCSLRVSIFGRDFNQINDF